MISFKGRAFWIAFPLAVTAVSILGVEQLRQHEASAISAVTENAASPAGGDNTAPAPPPPPPIVIPADTELEVRLDRSIATNRVASGDPFYATLADPVVVGGQTVIAPGAPVAGRVVYAHRAGRLKGVAEIRLELTSLQIDGNNYPLDASTVARFGHNHNKRNWAMIGGGGGGGALLGALIGGGKGALIGGPIGVGAGVATAAISEKRDIVIPAETAMTFELRQPLEVSQY